MRRVNPNNPKPDLPIWTQEGKHYFTTKELIEAELQKSGNPDRMSRLMMGANYSFLMDAMSGKKLDGYEARFVEHGIMRPKVKPLGWIE